MKVSQQIRMLCANRNISIAELARLTGQSPQNLNAKLKRESFTIADLEKIAAVVGAKFEKHFILQDNEII